MSPLVSIIMPVYNCEKYLIESIQSILNQTYSPLELICVNDGSTDISLELLKGFGNKITVINLEKNSGIAAGRNAGLHAVTGSFIAFADADDIWKPEKLALQMQQFDKNPKLDISFCMIQNFISPELPKEIQDARSFPAGPIPGQISGTFVVKKSSFDRIGTLNETYRVGEFIDWMARAMNEGFQQDMVPEVLYLRRVHASNTTLKKPTQVDYLKIAKAALDRKRSKNV